MSAVDYRRIEPVHCAGISIATFLSDDRNIIMVSITDLVEKLAMNVDLDEVECESYTAYDHIGRGFEHQAIPHTEINHFLWMNDCSDKFIHDLDEFRKYFAYEVISFWDRFQSAAASLSIRDAFKLIDIRSLEYHKKLGLISGRIYQVAIQSLGYNSIVPKDELTNEELALVTHAELLYASLAAVEQENGYSVDESMSIAERRIEKALRELGTITRGIGSI